MTAAGRATSSTRARTASPTTCWPRGWGAMPSGPRSPATSRARTTWRSTCTTAPSTWSRCSARGRRGSPRSTSTTATSPASCSTCSTTPAPPPSSSARHWRRRLPPSSRTFPACARSCRWPTAAVTPCCPARSGTTTRSPPPRPRARRTTRADDLYILYTGGTTGMPKGVLWRNGDAMVECFGASPTARTVADFVAEATTGMRALSRRRSCTARGTGSRSVCCSAAAPCTSSTARSASTPPPCGASSSVNGSSPC